MTINEEVCTELNKGYIEAIDAVICDYKHSERFWNVQVVNTLEEFKHALKRTTLRKVRRAVKTAKKHAGVSVSEREACRVFLKTTKGVK